MPRKQRRPAPSQNGQARSPQPQYFADVVRTGRAFLELLRDAGKVAGLEQPQASETAIRDRLYPALRMWRNWEKAMNPMRHPAGIFAVGVNWPHAERLGPASQGAVRSLQRGDNTLGPRASGRP